MQLVGLNFFAGDMPGGDRGLVSWPARTAEFRDNIDVTVGIGERLGCKAFNALYGNRIEGASPEQQDELGAENLALAARGGGADRRHRAHRAGQRGAGVPAADRRRCARGHRPGRRRRTSVCWPTSITWRSTATTSTRSSSTTPTGSRHVQIADAPGRNEPGTGSLPLLQQLTDLKAAGYDGWVGLEYKPSGASADSFGWIQS